MVVTREWLLVVYCIACLAIITTTVYRLHQSSPPMFVEGDERWLEGPEEIAHAWEMLHTQVSPSLSVRLRLFLMIIDKKPVLLSMKVFYL
jgi:hypothetical protein